MRCKRCRKSECCLEALRNPPCFIAIGVGPNVDPEQTVALPNLRFDSCRRELVLYMLEKILRIGVAGECPELHGEPAGGTLHRYGLDRRR